MNDSRTYKILTWLCSRPKQSLILVMLWRLRAVHEDRHRLKHEVRNLETELACVAPYRDAFFALRREVALQEDRGVLILR